MKQFSQNSTQSVVHGGLRLRALGTLFCVVLCVALTIIGLEAEVSPLIGILLVLTAMLLTWRLWHLRLWAGVAAALLYAGASLSMANSADDATRWIGAIGLFAVLGGWPLLRFVPWKRGI